MKKQTRTRLSKYLENYIQLLEGSDYARVLCGVSSDGLNQLRTDLENLKKDELE